MSTALSVRESFKRIDCLDNQKYIILRRLCNDHRGQFTPINTNSLKKIKKAINQEVSQDARLSFYQNEEMIEFLNIFICWRENSKYVFRLDSRNSFNETLREKIPQLEVYSLPCYGNFSYNFYFVLNQSELDQLFQIFPQWLSHIDINFDE
jgi:hypothetical protein